MNEERFTKTPDIYIAQNNGVVAIWPTSDGKLAALVATTSTGIERCWLFMDTPAYTEANDEVVDHIGRGVVCGQYADHEAFLAECRDLGLRCDSVGYSGIGVGYVPCSNGRRAMGTVRERGQIEARPCSDWTLSELKRVRTDLPNQRAIFDAMTNTAAAKALAVTDQSVLQRIAEIGPLPKG